MADKLKVYLAGPMTNCGDDQRKRWRKKIGGLARERGFVVLDPTREGARTDALAISGDIAECDLVIANMWKESIGTVLGIVQAQSLGIPVVLIDKNYMNSKPLNSLVDDIVWADKDVMPAVEKLAKEVQRQIIVQKHRRDGSSSDEPFSFGKLQRSLKAASISAGIDDPIFSTLLSRRVRRAIAEKAVRNGRISAEQIKDSIFEQLSELIASTLQLSPEDQRKISDHAKVMRDKWDGFVRRKHGANEWEELAGAYAKDCEEAAKEIEILSGKLIRKELEELARSSPSQVSKAQRGDAVAVILQEATNGRRALCVNRLGQSNFRAAFEHVGLGQEDFDRFFDLEECDGKQSNLNMNLKKWVAKYSLVLYAGDHLRHISDEKLKSSPNLFRGCGPKDAIRRFIDSRISV